MNNNIEQTKDRIEEIKNRLRHAEAAGDTQAQCSLMREYLQIQREMGKSTFENQKGGQHG